MGGKYFRDLFSLQPTASQITLMSDSQRALLGGSGMGACAQAWTLGKRLIAVFLVGSSGYRCPGDWVVGRHRVYTSGFSKSLLIQPIPTLLYPFVFLVSQQPTPTPSQQAILHQAPNTWKLTPITDFVCHWLQYVSLFSHNSSSLKPSPHSAYFRKILTSVAHAELSPLTPLQFSDYALIISFINSFNVLASHTYSVWKLICKSIHISPFLLLLPLAWMTKYPCNWSFSHSPASLQSLHYLWSI